MPLLSDNILQFRKIYFLRLTMQEWRMKTAIRAKVQVMEDFVNRVDSTDDAPTEPQEREDDLDNDDLTQESAVIPAPAPARSSAPAAHRHSSPLHQHEVDEEEDVQPRRRKVRKVTNDDDDDEESAVIPLPVQARRQPAPRPSQETGPSCPQA